MKTGIEKANDNMAELLQLDDKDVLKKKKLSVATKCYVFRTKYGNECASGWKHKLAASLKLRAVILFAEGESLIIQGRADEKYIGEEYQVEARDNDGNVFQAIYSPYPLFDFYNEDREKVFDGYEYILTLPLESGKVYMFYIKSKDWSKRIDLHTGRFSQLTDFEQSFFAAGKYIIKRFGDSIRIYDYRFSTYIASMHRYNRVLREKYGVSDEIIAVRRAAVRYRLTHKKPLWIMSDRSHLARDNAAAVFEYLMANEAGSRYDIRFLLEESSVDFDRIASIGRVVKFGSKEHHVLQAAASMVISSHADAWVTNPYGKDLKYYRDLLDYRFAFIQHGIIMNDLSGWLNKYKRNIRLFVTSTNPERKSIISDGYGYDSSIVRLTGLARYDSRKDIRKKLLIIAPTWRKDISGEIGVSSHRKYREDFASSEYCRFFNALINDDRLLGVMEKKGYKGLFCVHPAFEAQAGDFKGNGTVGVQYKENDYTDMVNRGSALITDYSSLAYDFAFLNKPVIYAQYDADVFYDSQFYNAGYFDYAEDGFGPVCYDYDTTINRMIDLVENDCLQPDEYADRVKRTFAFTDNNNCERIYKELETLQHSSFHVNKHENTER